MIEDLELWTSTEVSKLSRLLYRRSAQLEHLMNTLPLGVAVVTGDGKPAYANHAFHTQHPDIAALMLELREPFQTVLRELRQIGPVQVDGNWRVSLYPHAPASAILVSAAGAKGPAPPTEERQNLTLDLATLQLVGAPVGVIDESLQLVWLNQAFADLVGYKPEELLHSSYRRVDPDTPIEIAAANADIRATLRHQSGTQMSVEVRSRAAVHGGAPVRVLTVLQTPPDALPDAVAMPALERVAGQLSHRLNNLHMVILSYADLIRSEYGAVEALGTELQNIEEAAQAASRITQDLLTFSRGRPISPVVIEVDRAVASMASLFRSIAGPVSVRIFLHAPGAHVQFGLKELETVLLSVVRNAKESIAEDEGTITILSALLDLTSTEDRALISRLGLETESDYVKISVTDTGRSFPLEHQPCLFEPFFTTKAGASGMGLSVTYGIVKRSGGGVMLERLAAGGTKASIVLRTTVLAGA